MSATTWSKFFWSDWESDEALKMCSPAAQALWMRMLCICAKSGGYLVIRGNVLGPEEMAQHTGWPIAEVETWWAQLKKWEVFSVDGRHRVYCRRMTKDAKKAQTARENGKGGGNPNLRKREENSASDNQNPTEDATDLPGKPLSIIQSVSDANASSSPQADKAPRYPEPFDLVWKAYPHVKGRSDKPKSLGIWRRIPAEIRAQLPAAIARYARDGREPKADCGAPAFERWLRAERFMDWLDAGGAAASGLSAAQRLDHFRRTGMWRPDWGQRPEDVAA